MALRKRQGCAHRIVAVVTWSGRGEVSRADESDGGKRRGLRNDALPYSGGAAGRGRKATESSRISSVGVCFGITVSLAVPS